VWMPSSQERVWKTSALQNGLAFPVLLPFGRVRKKDIYKIRHSQRHAKVREPLHVQGGNMIFVIFNEISKNTQTLGKLGQIARNSSLHL
jgi:hypothetical protein